MSLDNNKERVIMIVGPTGVGKTRLSIDLALAIDGEVISADSRYLYRGMDIGTAKPSFTERKGVPHHLIDVADPDEIWTLAIFLDNTQRIINEILSRGKTPIIVGGTGQYMRALREGWALPSLEPDPDLRRVLSEWSDQIGKEAIHQKLKLLDAEAAEFIDVTNVRRTIRALEVILTTGQQFSTLRGKEGPAFDFWIIGLTMERGELYRRVDERIEAMVENNLIGEVQSLLEEGYSADLPAMSAIGYHEIIQYLIEEIDLDSAKEMMRKRTRQFIRRQSNWFKISDETIHWYSIIPYPLEKILADLEIKRMDVDQ